jgi:hypothetical protein
MSDLSSLSPSVSSDDTTTFVERKIRFNTVLEGYIPLDHDKSISRRFVGGKHSYVVGKNAPHTMEIGRVHVGGEHGLKGRFQEAIGQSVEAFLETVQSAYTLLEESRIGSEGERPHHFSTANIPSDPLWASATSRQQAFPTARTRTGSCCPSLPDHQHGNAQQLRVAGDFKPEGYELIA